MSITSTARNFLCVSALFMGVESANAQQIENIFVGGSRYVYDIYRGESVEESIARLPNKMIVPKAMLPRMAKIYRDCARKADFRAKVVARANVYSSHFSVVTLEQHPSMEDEKFSSSVSCVKLAVDEATRPTFTGTSNSSVVYSKPKSSTKAAPIYTSPAASFALKTSKLPQAQKISAQCSKASGFRGAAHLQVVRYKDSLAKLSLVRSGNMTNSQYEKTLSCMKAKFASF